MNQVKTDKMAGMKKILRSSICSFVFMMALQATTAYAFDGGLVSPKSGDYFAPTESVIVQLPANIAQGELGKIEIVPLRKVLADLAMNEGAMFSTIIAQSKAALSKAA